MNGQVLDISQIERQIERDIGDVHAVPNRPVDRLSPVAFAPPAQRRAALPDYVSPREGVSPLGVISAEAVVRQWEEAAKAIEAMGQDMRTIVERCQKLIAEAGAAVTFIDETAAYYREQGAKVFAEIESHSLLVEEVRKTCEAIQQKIAAQTSSA